MRMIREAIRLSLDMGLSDREISLSLSVARSTVAEYLKRFARAGLTWPMPADMDDRALELRLYPPDHDRIHARPEPDWAAVHRDLQIKGGTLTALHEEYLAEHPDGLQRSQFCLKYNKWAKTLKSYLRQIHPAGHNVFVDYAGPTFKVHDLATGGIAAHVRMFDFFGGVPLFIVCDNLKAGVTRASLSEPLVNDTFQAMASHYSAAVVPTRGYKPKDKAKAEGHVLLVERWIMFRLRNRIFTSLGELNDAIRELLVSLNERPFQKLPGCRRSAFEEIDKPALRPLPAVRYEYVEFRRARVDMDRTLDLDGRRFSAPPALVNAVLDVRVTAQSVELIHGGRRVALHPIPAGDAPVIDPRHLTPADHAYVMWTRERELDWARDIGPRTLAFVERQLPEGVNKTQGYRLGLSMRKLASEYGDARVESGCAYVLAKGGSRVSSLRLILGKGMDIDPPARTEAAFDHENLRGPDYYH